MRLLITGASGFVGRRLQVAARRRWPQAQVIAGAGPGEQGGLDVTDAEAVCEVVRRAAPTHVAHLAAIAAVPDASRSPQAAFAVNLCGALNVVEAVRNAAPAARLLHVSSAEVYGRSLREAGGRAVAETARLHPMNAYAASKAAGDLMVQAATEQGLSAVIARPFNHIGAGQTTAFALPSFASQIARAEAGLQPPVIEVGSLDDARDFLAVDDVVDAYLRLLDLKVEPRQVNIFNVASGSPVSIRAMLDALLKLSELAFEVRVDPKRLRPEPPSTYIGDAGRLRLETGWRPACTIASALEEVLSEQRAKVLAL